MPIFRPKEDLTPRQKEANRLLGGDATHCLLYGGARSGKSFIAVRALLIRALKAPKSRHGIFRLRFNHVRASIWLDTLPKVWSKITPEKLSLKEQRQDGYVKLENGSEIWFGGLDEKERTEKVLGQEYCVDLKAKILTADLRWLPADEIGVGQEIVAFPENLDGHTLLGRAVVERADRIEADRYRVVTDKGETVVSADHLFVAYYDDRRHKHERSLSWLAAKDVRPGHKIRYATAPWEVGESRDDGWLAGIFDGEGWLPVPAGACGMAQKPGLVLRRAMALLDERGIDYRTHDKTDRTKLDLRGLWASLRLLGMVRPHRPTPRAHELREETRGFIRKDGGAHVATVLSVEALGRGEVVAFGTSTRTLIADGFLGHNSTLLFEECSQIPYASVSIARTRLAQRTTLRLKAYYTENPPGTGHWSYQEFIDGRDPTSRGGLSSPEDYGALSMNPVDNLQHLPEGYLKSLEALPERQRRRFLHGRFGEEAEGALWTEEVLDRCRCTAKEMPAVTRTVVAVDPSGAKGREDLRSDEIGICVAAKGEDGRGYVLHDGSLRGSPEEWARAAVGLYDRYFADVIVAERNFGGDLVRAVIQGVRPGVHVKLLTASKGKAVRAEPVAALYEERQDKVRHVGTFPALEDQLTAFTSAGYTGNKSPDRADSLIWAISELMLDSEPLFYVG